MQQQRRSPFIATVAPSSQQRASSVDILQGYDEQFGGGLSCNEEDGTTFF